MEALAILFLAGFLAVLWRRQVRLDARLSELAARIDAGAIPRAAAPEEEPVADAISDAVVETPPELPETLPLPSTETAAAAPPTPGRDRVGELVDWLRRNWVYAVAATSLALAGLFLVQYGVETGLLTPAMRVMAALALGAALVAAGEFIRRRYGDIEGAPEGAGPATANLPSTLSGAGLVALYGAVVAARQLYGLIGAETGFAGLLAVSLLALVLGWFHGGLLAAVGLVGATFAPFLVGGDSAAPHWLYGHFALVALAGLGIDAVHRRGWVAVLALVLSVGAGTLLFSETGGTPGYAGLLTAVALMAVAVPRGRLVPDHPGPILSLPLFVRSAPRANPQVRLAGGTVLVASFLMLSAQAGQPADSLAVLALLAVLTLALTIWTTQAPGLADLAALPALAFLARLVLEGVLGGALATEFAAQSAALRPPGVAAPLTVSMILVLAAAMTAAAGWRSLDGGPMAAWWAGGAAVTASAAAVVLELFWLPAEVIGAGVWATHAMALAALMVVFAERFGRADGGAGRRSALMILAALSLIALSLFAVLTKGALTLALAVLAVTAAALDRRMRLPEMGWFVQLGAVVLGWRLVVDPGVDWAYWAPLWEVTLSHLAAIGGMVAVVLLLRGLRRPAPVLVAESAALGFAALFANVLLMRWMATLGPVADHWQATLHAMPWLIAMTVQLYRLRAGGPLARVRIGFAAVAGVLGIGGLALAVFLHNPLLDPWERVRGPMGLDTLTVAYLLPVPVFALIARRFGHLPVWLTRSALAIAIGLGALWAGLEIRRFWRGDVLAVPGVTQPELYSYTVAMLLAGAGTLYQAIASRSASLRRLAMTLIGLTVAKVFLIDAAGLSGLYRVAAFLGLGLALAALAWLNRWALLRSGGPGDGPLPQDEGPQGGAGRPA